MATIAMADTNVVELSVRRARRNLRAINEAKGYYFNRERTLYFH